MNDTFDAWPSSARPSAGKTAVRDRKRWRGHRRARTSASNQARAPSRLNALNFSWKKNTSHPLSRTSFVPHAATATTTTPPPPPSLPSPCRLPTSIFAVPSWLCQPLSRASASFLSRYPCSGLLLARSVAERRTQFQNRL